MDGGEDGSIQGLVETIDRISEESTAAQVNTAQIFVLVTACRYIRLQIDVWAARYGSGAAIAIAAAAPCFQQLHRVLAAALDLVRRYSTPDWIEKPWLYVARENGVVFAALLEDLAVHVDLAAAALLGSTAPGNAAMMRSREWMAVLRKTSWEYFKGLRCGMRISAGEDKARLIEMLDGTLSSSVTENLLRSAAGAESTMDWIAPSELDLDDTQPLGHGSFGVVFQTNWAGHKVAVKKFSKELWAAQEPWEGEIMVKLRPCHPSVLQILGWSEKDEKTYLVMELMQGSLARHISSLVHAPLMVIVDIMLQVAQGMDFVHKKRIIHRDLKPGNVLVNFDGRIEDGTVRNIVAKVADFGLSKMNFSSNHYHSHLKGTMLYMAPEMLEGDWEMRSPYERSVDVYSYGMMCAEMLTGATPYPLGLSKKALRDEILRGLRPRLPERCPQALKDTIAYCWDVEPRRRPAFENICTRLLRLKGELLTGSVYFMPDAGITVKGKLLVGEKLVGHGSFVTDSEWSTCYWVRHHRDGSTLRLTPALEINSRGKYPEYVITGCDYDSSIELVCISIDRNQNTTTTSSAFAGYGGVVDCGEYYRMTTCLHYAVKVFEDDVPWKGKLEIKPNGLMLSNRTACGSSILEPFGEISSIEVAPIESSLAECVIKGGRGTYRLQFAKRDLRDLAVIAMKRSIQEWRTQNRQLSSIK